MLISEIGADGDPLNTKPNWKLNIYREKAIFYVSVACSLLITLTLIAIDAASPIALLAPLLFKHFLCDYLLQSSSMLSQKHDLRALGGYLHSGLHALGSALILMFFVSWWTVLLIVALEFIVHLLLDFGKAQWVRKLELSETNLRYWHLFGLDQWLHALTYLVMAAVVFR